jgi:hypothetical protein
VKPDVASPVIGSLVASAGAYDFSCPLNMTLYVDSASGTRPSTVGTTIDLICRGYVPWRCTTTITSGLERRHRSKVPIRSQSTWNAYTDVSRRSKGCSGRTAAGDWVVGPPSSWSLRDQGRQLAGSFCGSSACAPFDVSDTSRRIGVAALLLSGAPASQASSSLARRFPCSPTVVSVDGAAVRRRDASEDCNGPARPSQSSRRSHCRCT